MKLKTVVACLCVALNFKKLFFQQKNTETYVDMKSNGIPFLLIQQEQDACSSCKTTLHFVLLRRCCSRFVQLVCSDHLSKTGNEECAGVCIYSGDVI